MSSIIFVGSTGIKTEILQKKYWKLWIIPDKRPKLILSILTFNLFITMRKLLLLSVLLASILMLTGCIRSGIADLSRTTSFDEGWKFLKGDPANAENPSFDDSGWREVDLPHDWSIEDLPDQVPDSIIGPFSKASVGKMFTGYSVGGTAWYRKTFTLNSEDKDRIVYLMFDGVYMNSDVWVNGRHAGNHPYGYTSFWYNITPFLNPAGEKNTVAVQVKNEGLNARWYSGSGIYRHTWLTMVNPVHITPWGIFITTPKVTEKDAGIEIVTNVTNQGKEAGLAVVKVEIIDPQGKIAGTVSKDQQIPAGSSTDISQSIEIVDPLLWSVEKPDLYKARVTVSSDSKLSDVSECTFGIRTIHFDALTGFTLNGKSMELRGGCIHHDNGPLGAAAIDRAEERKIELLKQAGFNAIRCSHNPPSPYLLDVCDRLGMLVIDEAFDMWEKSKMATFGAIFGQKDVSSRDYDYSAYFRDNWQKDIESMVKRDRNHPSIIMWSIGNEIVEAADTSGLRIAENLTREVRRSDNTRAITEAHVDLTASLGGKSSWEAQARVMALHDVVGYNYRFMDYEADHRKYPDRVMFGSETMEPVALQNWQLAEKLPYVLGGFTWTAMDYLGESGIGLAHLVSKEQLANLGTLGGIALIFNPDSWPVFNAFCGDLDLIGNRKAASYYQNVVWRNSKLEILVHRPVPAGKTELTSPWGMPDELKCWTWNGHEGEQMQVHVYTRSGLVRLELNGKTIGEQSVDDSKTITAIFMVPYEPGTLTARCFDNGTETASETIRTTGNPAAVRLTADRASIRADRNDLSYILAEVVDAEGNVVTGEDNILIKFDVSGNGKIAGVGNGSPTDLSSFRQPQKKVWQGRCLVVVRPDATPGKLILKADAEGLSGSSLEIVAN
jgi:beta-galactosidase